MILMWIYNTKLMYNTCNLSFQNSFVWIQSRFVQISCWTLSLNWRNITLRKHCKYYFFFVYNLFLLIAISKKNNEYVFILFSMILKTIFFLSFSYNCNSETKRWTQYVTKIYIRESFKRYFRWSSVVTFLCTKFDWLETARTLNFNIKCSIVLLITLTYLFKKFNYKIYYYVIFVSIIVRKYKVLKIQYLYLRKLNHSRIRWELPKKKKNH